MILVDTSVLIDFLQGRDTPAAARLQSLEEEGTPFAVPALCCQEVLQGAKDEKEWRLLGEYLGSQTVVLPCDPRSTHVAAARIFFDCRRKGLTIRSSIDCLIAQLAIEEGAVLLHDDGDFDHIQKIRPLRTLRL